MHYKESSKILKKIKFAEKIIVNCHRSPDSDSVGSALAMRQFLIGLNKEVTIICPSDVPEDLKFLPGAEEIKKVDFGSFKFSEYDLFLALDTSTYALVSGDKELNRPKDIEINVIDHHVSNDNYGDITLLDAEATSTGELLYKVFGDWEVTFTPEISECLLTGIIGDTGCFQYQNVGSETLSAAADLIKSGADKDKIISNIYRSIGFGEVKTWGRIIERMELDEDYGFVWAVFSAADYADLTSSDNIKEDAANLFFPIIKNTDFGIVMEEREGDILSVSFRSRSGFDVSQIAKELGGGGHKAAAATRLEGLPREEAVEKVLKAARKYAIKKSP
jgi:phosphoesterase RecJ-like protein